MSISLRNSLPPHFGHAVFFFSSDAASYLYQASAPSRSNSSTIERFTFASFSGSWQPSHRNTAIGTPQILCREIVQSGLVATMFEIRSSPQLGSHVTRLISSSARCRKVVCFLSSGDGTVVSIPINHCSVARKISGLWQRQQCG